MKVNTIITRKTIIKLARQRVHKKKGGMPLIFPIIPLLALVAVICGGATLGWYSRLTDEEKDLVNELALELFEKTVQELNKSQSKLLRSKFFK